MARISQEEFSGQSDASSKNILEINADNGDKIEVSSNNFIADAEITRDGQDLVLEADNGETIVINGYFTAEPTPMIESPNGSVLTPNLVNSFLQSSDQYAQSSSMNDESPVGAVEEVSGSANVIRADGSSEPITLGTPIYKGDVIETSETGAVNIVFIDETSMAVSENARLSVDEYQFDPSTESGETNFSVLRGVFVFTSGLIGRDDPDDVQIDTPVGSIGIRGTIIAGKIQPDGESEITVVEGAIVVKNGAMEKTLSVQYESIKLGGFNDNMQNLGVKDASDVGKTYGSVSDVVPKLFSSINDTVKEESHDKAEAKAEEAMEEQLLEKAEEIKAEEQLVEEQAPDMTLETIDHSESFNSENKVQVDKQDGVKEKIQDRNFRNLNDPRFNNPDIENVNPAAQNNNNNNNNGVQDSPLSAVAADGSDYFITAGNPNAGKIFADINGDGIKDFASIDFGSGNLEIVNGSTNNVWSNNNATNFKEISLIGDLNNDGFADLVASNPNTANGLVFEILGGSVSPSSTTTNGVSGGSNFGRSVAGIGDFDGDGTSDYAIGSTGVNSGNGKVLLNLTGAGATDIQISGTSTEGLGAHISGIGDINGDGFSDVMYGSQAPSSNYKAEIILGNSGGTNNSFTITGASKIIAGGAAGDMNGDGYDDFAISMKNGNDIDTYIVFGSDGINSVNLADPNQALQVTHAGAGNASDYSINSVGDKDGDGFDDLQIGVAGGPQFTVHGRVSDPTDTSIVRDGINDVNTAPNEISASADNQALVGDAADYSSNVYTGLSMRGGNSDNTFHIQNNGFKNLDGGKGHDTISVDSNIDFSNIDFEAISQIERLEFGQNSRTITLSAENIFNLLKSSDTGELKIESKAGISGSSLEIDATTPNGTSIQDKIVNALNEEGAGATHVSSSGGFDHYQIGGYNLYIDSAVTTLVI